MKFAYNYARYDKYGNLKSEILQEEDRILNDSTIYLGEQPVYSGSSESALPEENLAEETRKESVEEQVQYTTNSNEITTDDQQTNNDYVPVETENSGLSEDAQRDMEIFNKIEANKFGSQAENQEGSMQCGLEQTLEPAPTAPIVDSSGGDAGGE